MSTYNDLRSSLSTGHYGFFPECFIVYYVNVIIRANP